MVTLSELEPSPRPLPGAGLSRGISGRLQAPPGTPLLWPTDSESAHMAFPKCLLLYYGEILGGLGASPGTPHAAYG